MVQFSPLIKLPNGASETSGRARYHRPGFQTRKILKVIWIVKLFDDLSVDKGNYECCCKGRGTFQGTSIHKIFSNKENLHNLKFPSLL